MTQLFFARDQTCSLDTSKLKQRRNKKEYKQSVVCVSCSAEYHLDCLIQAYKNFQRGQTKSQQDYTHTPIVGKRNNYYSKKLSCQSVQIIKGENQLQTSLEPNSEAKLEQDALKFLSETLGIKLAASKANNVEIKRQHMVESWTCLSCLLS